MNIVMISPNFCQHCGWKPTIPTNENQAISIENQWLTMPIPNSVVWLYICPKCNCVMANKNCIQNIKQLNEKKEQRIIEPKSQKVVDLLRSKN